MPVPGTGMRPCIRTTENRPWEPFGKGEIAVTKQELKDKAHSLPLSPGVYIMMDKAGTVIYVGKSRALKNRVSQSFADLASHTSKTRAMVSQIDHFDYILADKRVD